MISYFGSCADKSSARFAIVQKILAGYGRASMRLALTKSNFSYSCIDGKHSRGLAGWEAN